MQISANAQALAYLASAVLFIFSLKGLTHPATARRGNLLGMIGMALAVAATLLGSEVQSYGFIIAGVVLGGLIEDALRESDQRVPVLGSIPVLGALFRSQKTEKIKTNLMIFIRSSARRKPRRSKPT